MIRSIHARIRAFDVSAVLDHPTLDVPELEAIHLRFYESRSPEDLALLLERYEPLAQRLASQSATRAEDREDLAQVAQVALVTALENFDPHRGISFVTFGWVTVQGHLKRHHRDHDWSVRVPRSLQERSRRARAAAERLCHELGRTPTTAEIAARAGILEEEVDEAIEAEGAYRAAPIDSTGDGEESLSRMLAVDDEGFTLIEERRLLHALLSHLSDREREIVRLRFVEELTQAEIAARTGTTQVGVSRLLTRSLAKLRTWASYHS